MIVLFNLICIIIVIVFYHVHHNKYRWISVGDYLPKVDEFVLWRYESGGIIMAMIDKDMELEDTAQFLEGTDVAGPITHWMRIPEVRC